jgi:hypothetical protein
MPVTEEFAQEEEWLTAWGPHVSAGRGWRVGLGRVGAKSGGGPQVGENRPRRSCHAFFISVFFHFFFKLNSNKI